MERKQLFCQSFEDLLKETPYEKITVSEICRRAGLSRKIFYGCFRDKEELVEELFYVHAVHSTRQLNQVFGFADLERMGSIVQSRIYEGLQSKREYYTNLARTTEGCGSVFVTAATRVLERLNRELFEKMGSFPNERTRDYVCYYYAAAQAMLLQYWINDGMSMPPAELGALCREMTGDFLHRLATGKLGY